MKLRYKDDQKLRWIGHHQQSTRTLYVFSNHRNFLEKQAGPYPDYESRLYDLIFYSSTFTQNGSSFQAHRRP